MKARIPERLIVLSAVAFAPLASFGQSSNAHPRTGEVVERTVVAPGSEMADPIVRSTQTAALEARLEWRSALLEYLREAVPNGNADEREAATAEFIRANFEAYVALEEKAAIARDSLLQWRQQHRTEAAGMAELSASTKTMLIGADADEKRFVKAYQRAAQQLLELEEKVAQSASKADRNTNQ